MRWCGEKIDRLICTKFPSYVVKHHCKVVWLIQQFRQAYDLYNTPYSDLQDSKEGKAVKDKIVDIDNITLRESKKIFTNSKNTAGRLMRYNNIKGEPLYHPPKNADKFYCGDFGDYIIYPSRIESIKRQYLLMKAMKYTRSNAKCLIVGKGPQEREIKQLANNLKVNDKVKFCGYIPDDELIGLYANSLGVFYAPYDEDFGYVTLEAFLSRKPVITTTDSGGPLEFVEDGTNGYVASFEPKNIAEKIDNLFEDEEMAKRMGNSGYKKIKSLNITWDNVIKKLVGV
jgi:glycosyltransferase involved in cell wall biosynthesis